MFADDINLFYSYRNTQTLFKTANKELGCIEKWFRANKFFVNILFDITYHLNYLN